MKELKYQIKMLSDWHIGSGLDSATDADALVLKNNVDQPYIPGKTIKGLIKDALEDMIEVNRASEKALIRIFGKIKKEVNPGEKEQQISFSGNAFFSNAELPTEDSTEITDNNLSDYLYRNLASTAIGKNGVAQNKSLRVIQVTNPLTLEGYISGLNDEDHELLKKAIKLVRRLGVNRNRGLGRCKFISL